MKTASKTSLKTCAEAHDVRLDTDDASEQLFRVALKRLPEKARLELLENAVVINDHDGKNGKRGFFLFVSVPNADENL